MRLAVVIAAAGGSHRFGSNKLEAMIGGRTVLELSVAALRQAMPDAPMVAVVAADRVEFWRSLLATGDTDLEVMAGGRRRQDSVRIGVDRASELGVGEVVVHDAARPAVRPEDVLRVSAALGSADGAILCARPVDTVKRVDDTGVVIETLDRSVLRLAQTPQVFRVSALERAWLAQGPEPEWSDEAALLEACGSEIRTVIARHPNPKLTTPSDLGVMRSLIGGDG